MVVAIRVVEKEEKVVSQSCYYCVQSIGTTLEGSTDVKIDASYYEFRVVK